MAGQVVLIRMVITSSDIVIIRFPVGRERRCCRPRCVLVAVAIYAVALTVVAFVLGTFAPIESISD